MDILRGDVVEVDFGDAVGSEQGGSRPAIVIQNDVGNKFSPTSIVMPITSRPKKRGLPTHGKLYANEPGGLRIDSTFLAEQIRAVDKSRITAKYGRLQPDKMAEVDLAIYISLSLKYFGGEHVPQRQCV